MWWHHKAWCRWMERKYRGKQLKKDDAWVSSWKQEERKWMKDDMVTHSKCPRQRMRTTWTYTEAILQTCSHNVYRWLNPENKFLQISQFNFYKHVKSSPRIRLLSDSLQGQLSYLNYRSEDCPLLRCSTIFSIHVRSLWKLIRMPWYWSRLTMYHIAGLFAIDVQ